MEKSILAFRTLCGLAFIGFLSVNFIVPLTQFIVFENVLYSLIFLVSLILSLKDKSKASLIAFSSSLFIAGRISRSIIDSEGLLASLWLDHLPVAISLLILASIAIYVFKKK